MGDTLAGLADDIARVSIDTPHANRVQRDWLTLQVTTRTGDRPKAAVPSRAAKVLIIFRSMEC